MGGKNILKELIKFTISIFTAFAVSINTSKTSGLFEFYNGNSFLWIIVLIFIYEILTKVIKVNDKRLKIIALLGGILLSTFAIVGNSINQYMNLSGIFSSKILLIKSIIKWTGYIILIASTLIIVFDKYNKLVQKEEKEEDLEDKKTIISKWFNDNKRNFWVCFLVIFIAWLPYLLKYYPGVLTPDSVDQVRQALGINIVNAHHPLFHTLIIKVCMKVGCVIGNQNTGVLIYSIMQMLTMSAIFSFTIFYMAKKRIPKWIRILALIFFAVYPVNGLYSITMWKNILSAGMILLFTICMVEIITEQGKFFVSKWKWIAMVLISLILIYTLNNGLYIVLLSIPVVFLVTRKYWKKTTLIFIIIFVVHFIINTVLFSILDIKKGSIREALSIPLQQFARVVKYSKEDLADKEMQSIYNFLPSDELGKLYNPTLSDPVKAVFNDEYFSKNKLEFITTWVKLFFKFPKGYIESFLCNCYGYWYPEATNWVAARYIQHDEALNIYQSSKINGELIGELDSLIDKRDIPIFSMMFSLGFAFWLVITVMLYCIYVKKYSLITVYVPVLILWLTVIASPVFCEFRYLYGMIICLPILLSVPLLNRKELI